MNKTNATDFLDAFVEFDIFCITYNIWNQIYYYNVYVCVT